MRLPCPPRFPSPSPLWYLPSSPGMARCVAHHSFQDSSWGRVGSGSSPPDPDSTSATAAAGTASSRPPGANGGTCSCGGGGGVVCVSGENNLHVLRVSRLPKAQRWRLGVPSIFPNPRSSVGASCSTLCVAGFRLPHPLPFLWPSDAPSFLGRSSGSVPSLRNDHTGRRIGSLLYPALVP